ncbi:MAG: hypothetical protein DMG63_10280 [Acidobacteria bacterium]|nr:MAG: hypothetical protein DMG63_10280 [Acidobacteriota bacterium]
MLNQLAVARLRDQLDSLSAFVANKTADEWNRVRQLSSLSDEQLARTGIHPVLGEMDVPLWLEFFLLHEAHHLYAILFRLRES